MKPYRKSYSDKIFNFINITLLTFILAIVLYPLIYILSASISDPDIVNAGKVWLLPKGIQFDGYRRVFQDGQIFNGYKNTIIYTLVGTAISLFITMTAAYALSRKDLFGNKTITLLFTFTMFFGGGLIPTFLLVKPLMYNTMWALIIPGAASMFRILITRTFYQSTIPVELQEAASMDGCSDIKVFISIIFPLSKPIIAVMALYYGIDYWNSYFSAMIYLPDEKKWPLQLVLREILVINQMSADMMSTDSNMELEEIQAKLANLIKYAVMVVSSIPLIAVYPFLQKYFTKGMMIGAIKG